MPPPVYLDENGNPVSSPPAVHAQAPVYLDDNGEPVGAQQPQVPAYARNVLREGQQMQSRRVQRERAIQNFQPVPGGHDIPAPAWLRPVGDVANAVNNALRPVQQGLQDNPIIRGIGNRVDIALNGPERARIHRQIAQEDSDQMGANPVRIAASIGSMGTPAGGAALSLPGLMADSGALGWVGGAVGADPDLTPQQRLDEANQQGLINAAIPAGLHVAGGAVGQVAGLASNVYSRFGLNAEQRAARMINRRLQNAGTDMNELRRRASALRRQGGITQETIAEIGGAPLRTAAQAVANVPGPGQSAIAERLAARTEDITPRVLGEATRATSPTQTRSPRNYWDAREQLRTARSGQARDAYRAAYSDPNMDHDLINNQVVPLMRQGSPEALASAERQLETEQLRIRAQLAQASSPQEVQALQSELADATHAGVQVRALRGNGEITGPISARTLDFYQRGLRHLAETAGEHTQEGSALAAARSAFNSLTDRAAPALADARQTYGASLRIQDMMDAGRRVFNMPEGELDLTLRNPTREEFDGFMLGALDAIETKVRSGDTSFIARFMRNENWQRQLTRALGPAASRRLINRIAREAGMRSFQNEVVSGSRTTPMAENIRDLTQGESELGFLNDFVQGGGNVRGPIVRFAGRAWDRINNPGIRNPQVNAAMTERLMNRATPANISQLENEINSLPRLARYNGIGEQTQDMIGRLSIPLAGMGQNAFTQGVAEASGIPDAGRAAQSFSQGRYGEGASETAMAALSMGLPLMRGPRAMVAGALGLGALAVGGEQAQAAEDTSADARELEAARAEVHRLEQEGQIFSSVNPSDPASVRAAQQILLTRGQPVRVDGVLGGATAAAIRQYREDNTQQLTVARQRQQELEQAAAARATRASPETEALREFGPYAGYAVGSVLGHYGIPGLRGLGGRAGAVESDAARIAARNARADAMMADATGAPVRTGTNAGRRQANVNEFWRQGGAGENVPFRPANTQRGFAARPGAAEASALFQPGPARFRTNDVATILGAGGESAFAHVMLDDARRQLAQAQEEARRHPTEANLAKVESISNMIAILGGVENAGRGYAFGRTLGAVTHPYSQERPVGAIATAEAERSALNRHLAGRRAPPPSTGRRR